MQFRKKTLREIAEMICGNFAQDSSYFEYRSSSYLTEFFQDIGTDFSHDGSTRALWVTDRLAELLQLPRPAPNTPPEAFARAIERLMDKADAVNEGPDRPGALALLNTTLQREGYEAF